MRQLPIFVTLAGRKVILIGTGEAADAKARLIDRAGGIIVGEGTDGAVLAFVAPDDDAEADAAAARLKARGLLVNVVDRPALCDFTTPAIIDRDPVLIAIGTGGASAGLAKALRQRLELLLPHGLGALAEGLKAARGRVKARWPGAADRRRAIDAALEPGGLLDPMAPQGEGAIGDWLSAAADPEQARIETIRLTSADPDDLTLRAARLLGQADRIFHDAAVPVAILARARADALRHVGQLPDEPGLGLTIVLLLPSGEG